MRSSIPPLRFLSVLACALGLVVAAAPAASAVADRPSASARAEALARAAVERLLTSRPATTTQTSGLRPDVTITAGDPFAGYAATGPGPAFTQVSGSWKEPTDSCTAVSALVDFEAGLDGLTSGTAEQVGTVAECYEGVAYNYTWWEMYPTNSIQVRGESVIAGDSITASVVRSGTSYTLSVTDSTHPANSFTTVQSCSGCANSSAELLAQDASGDSATPLVNFGTWTLTNCDVAAGGPVGVIGAYDPEKSTMTDSSGYVLAQPSALTSNGGGFTVTWMRST